MKTIAFLLILCCSACAELSVLNTFTSGELSPHLDARVDFDKYASGCRVVENFIALPYGGAKKRSGTQYIAATKSNWVSRLAPFSVGVDQTYVLEFGQQYIRFYADGVQIPDGTNSTPLEVSTPYTTNDVFQLQMAQFADVMYVVHPDYPPYILTRTSTTPTFTFVKMTFDWPPVIDENIISTTITSAATTGSVTLTASSALFNSNSVNSAYVLRSPNVNASVEISLTTNATSGAITVEGDWNLRTIGAGFDGTVVIQTSEDNGITWGDYLSYESDTSDTANKVNYDRSGTEAESGILYRIDFRVGGDVSKGNAYLKCEEPYLNGWCIITNYLSPTTVVAVVQSPFGSTNATEIWYEGAFNENRGYPRSVAFFENRLVFGGTDYMVNALWASMTDNYGNFKTGEYDDSSLRFSINSDNIIEWLLAKSQLFVGTLGDEWIVSGGDSSTPLTPTTVLARRQTGFGSKDGIPAIIASDSIVYIQRQGRKLREFEYNLETDGYKSRDMTILAEHITKGGIVQYDDMQQPEPIIWCVRGDGELLGLTYNKEQNVIGWHRQKTDGQFESIAIIPTDGEDRIYVVVNRDNGRFIEWFRPFDWGDDEDAWFVDSGLDFDGGDAVDFSITDVVTNGIVVDCNNSFSDGDYVAVNGEINHKDYSGTPFQIITATSTNLLIDYDYAADENFVITITNAGSSAVNGTYYYYRQVYSKPAWTNSSSSLQVTVNSNGYWIITCGFEYYTNSAISSLPPKTGWDISVAGDPDAPTLDYVYSGTGTVQNVQKTFTNMLHLAGQTVDVFADGGVQPQATVGTNGVLTISDYKNRVIAGLPYTATLSPMYIDVATQEGISYSKVKNPYRAMFRVLDSGTFNYGSATNLLYPVSVRLPDLTAGSPVPFYSGDLVSKPIQIIPSTSPQIFITSDKPLPLELLSLSIYTDVKEIQ